MMWLMWLMLLLLLLLLPADDKDEPAMSDAYVY